MEKYWSRFADNFDAKQTYTVGSKLIESVKLKLSEQKTLCHLLELGCGNGNYTRCIIDGADSVIATDYSIQMVNKTKELFSQNSKVKVEQADCHKTIYNNNSFDTVLMANLIHIIDEPNSVIKEVNRILKPGGQLIVTSFTTEEMNIIHKLGLLIRYLQVFKSFPKKTTFTRHTLNILLKQNGFSISEAVLLGKKTKSLFIRAVKRG